MFLPKFSLETADLLTICVNLHIISVILHTQERGNPMEITGIKIKKLATDNKMKAIASITIDDCFAIHDIKVIENEDKVFVAMPNKRLKDGTFKDVAHPINFETRANIEKLIIDAYNNAEIEE